MPRTASLPSKHSDNPTRHVADGRVFVKEFTPCYPEMKTSGGILIPGQASMGKAFYKRKDDGSEEMIQADSSVVFAVVTGCGLKINRSTCQPFPPEDQRDFPLPIGSYVKISRCVDHTVGPNEKSYNTYDIQEYVLAGEPVPEWAEKFHAENARAHAM